LLPAFAKTFKKSQKKWPTQIQFNYKVKSATAPAALAPSSKNNLHINIAYQSGHLIVDI
jgi:hypothetical protein